MACIFYKPEKKLVFCIEKIASPAGESQKKATIVVGSTAQATCGCMQLLAIVFKERRNTRICFVYTQALAKFCLHRVYSWTLPYGKSYASVTYR